MRRVREALPLWGQVATNVSPMTIARQSSSSFEHSPVKVG
jgi:hypothetical protein